MRSGSSLTTTSGEGTGGLASSGVPVELDCADAEAETLGAISPGPAGLTDAPLPPPQAARLHAATTDQDPTNERSGFTPRA
jgi:hypothetical protein